MEGLNTLHVNIKKLLKHTYGFQGLSKTSIPFSLLKVFSIVSNTTNLRFERNLKTGFQIHKN